MFFNVLAADLPKEKPDHSADDDLDRFKKEMKKDVAPKLFRPKPKKSKATVGFEKFYDGITEIFEDAFCKAYERYEKRGRDIKNLTFEMRVSNAVEFYVKDSIAIRMNVLDEERDSIDVDKIIDKPGYFEISIPMELIDLCGVDRNGNLMIPTAYKMRKG